MKYRIFKSPDEYNITTVLRSYITRENRYSIKRVDVDKEGNIVAYNAKPVDILALNKADIVSFLELLLVTACKAPVVNEETLCEELGIEYVMPSKRSPGMKLLPTTEVLDLGSNADDIDFTVQIEFETLIEDVYKTTRDTMKRITETKAIEDSEGLALAYSDYIHMLSTWFHDMKELVEAASKGDV